MEDSDVEVSIVIPAYNEAKRIELTLNRIFSESTLSDFEVIVSEDGSTDETPHILAKLAKRYQGELVVLHSKKRLGKGGGFLRGVLSSRGRFVLLLDADFPSNFDSLVTIVKHLRSGYDVVVGSRAHRLSRLDPPPPVLRQAIGRVFNSIVRILFKVSIHDTQCGVKGFRKEIFRIIGPIQFTSFVFDVEIIVKAWALGLKLVEVPIYWSSKVGSKVHVLRDAIFILNGVLNIWLRLPGYKQRIMKMDVKHASGEGAGN